MENYPKPLTDRQAAAVDALQELAAAATKVYLRGGYFPKVPQIRGLSVEICDGAAHYVADISAVQKDVR